jgi:putative flavoprotein involved in K+ transport
LVGAMFFSGIQEVYCMVDLIETIIIGGGQAGLATSDYLSQMGREHLVLEQASKAGNAWRNERWDSFTFVTPNWMIRLPGAEYQGDDPDGYLPRDEIVRYFEQYVERFSLPVRYGVRVTAVEQSEMGYLVQTGQGNYRVTNVVIATGFFQKPKRPSFSANLPAEIVQLHTSQYRNPAQLPPGAVLVVGSGQSGCQIAEELYLSGRKVFLSVGSTGRLPRRYRGMDITWWLFKTEAAEQTVDQLPSPEKKFVGNPQATGVRGGHTINLHQFVRDGVVLLGHLKDVQGWKLNLAPDLRESLAKVDQFEADALKRIDEGIARSGLKLPEEKLPELRDGYAAEIVPELDLKTAGITSIIWAMGYQFDYSLVKLPVVDVDGFPLQKRGVTNYSGLYFIGMPWLFKRQSSLLYGIGEDAEWITAAIAGK